LRKWIGIHSFSSNLKKAKVPDIALSGSFSKKSGVAGKPFRSPAPVVKGKKREKE
jgi:hypothetical protein